MSFTLRGFLAARRVHLTVRGALLLGAGEFVGAQAASPELGHPIIHNHPPGEHLSHVVSYAVTQDRADNVVFSSGGDLLSYDGTKWSHPRLPTESAGIRRFAVTADGTVFVCGAGAIGFLRGVGEQAVYVSLIDRLPAEARKVDELNYAAAIGNTVYFSDEEKILIWREGGFAVVPYPTPAHSHGARLHRVGETLYVTALGCPLSRMTGERMEVVADDPVLRENQIVSVGAGAAPGALVLLTAERGFFQLAGGRVTPLPVEANRWLESKRIFRALRLADGSHVVAFSATSGDGGARFGADGRYLGPLDTSAGLLAKTLRDFFVDREGGLWIGLETGSARLEWPSSSSIFDVTNGLGRGSVADVVRHDHVLHAATGEGVFRLVPADDAGRNARFERVFGSPCYALASHPGGLLVLGYAELFVSSPAGFVSVARLPSGGGVLLRSQKDPDRVWVGTSSGVRSVRSTAQGWRDEGAIPGIVEACRGLSESADGSLWVATQQGELIRWRDGREPVRIGKDLGLPELLAKAGLATWGGEPVLVCDRPPRVLRFEPGRDRFGPVAGATQLSGETGAEAWVVGSAGETLWLGSEQAIYRVTRAGAECQRLPHLVGAAAGQVAHLYEETGPGGDVLWVAGTRGLVRVELKQAFAVPVAFAAQLRTANVAAGERLAPEHRLLTFEYVAPRHGFGNEVVFQTRLVGFEDAWSGWEATRVRSFPHLSPGDYRFEVRARDADGEISTPASLAFVVLAPWWRAWWALLGYAAAGTGLVAGVVRLRTRALRQRAERLEQVVAERTVELAKNNRELTRLNRLELDEKISARLGEEKARLEVLRYQLNPHFLFNTLASISATLPAGASTPRTMVERLAEFCRLTLHRQGDRDWTTLGEEMQLLRAYLEIEQSRWGALLDVEIACDSALDGERLPHFLLLPLVENALKYGRATSPDSVGLRLGVSRGDDGALVFIIANTGKWIEPAAKKTVSTLGIGLENLHERLERHYPQAHTFTLSHADGWVTVALRIFSSPVSS